MSDKPNIVFLHVDQLKWSAIGINGCTDVATPNMDRLLGDAVRFDRSYCAVPVCVPARTSWYTGLEPEQSGIANNARQIEVDEVHPTDLGSWLRDQGGYGCYYMGKWHIGLGPKACGFERAYGSNHIGEYGDMAVARAAEAFLVDPPQDGKPFFLNVGLLNPHDICYWGYEYDPAKDAMAEEIKDQLPELPPNFMPEKSNHDWSELQWRFYAYSYFRFVEMVDEEIGRIYRAYLRSPQRGNTIFIFSADHGQGNGEHAHTTKGQPYEHSTRVPLGVVDPQETPRCDATSLVTGLDMAPTICDYAGVPKMPRNNGQSFRPLIYGEAVEWRNWLALTTPQFKERMILKGDWKLTYERWSGENRLYNLKNDPWEITDLSRDSAHAEVLNELDVLRTQYDAGREYCSMAQKDLERWNH